VTIIYITAMMMMMMTTNVHAHSVQTRHVVDGSKSVHFVHYVVIGV